MGSFDPIIYYLKKGGHSSFVLPRLVQDKK